MFEKAFKEKFRFDTPQGQITVEDLYDIPLTSVNKNRANLDDIARGLSKQLKEQEIESFVIKPPKADEATAVKFEIVKHIIAERLKAAEEAAVAKKNKEKKQQILALIAQKETEQLAGQSIDDLRKMVENL